MAATSEDATDAYASIARWYDLEHDAYTEDIAFYRDLAIATGRVVLEIGCGSGRVTAPLAMAGCRITGVDASSAMLAACRKRLMHLPPDVAQRVSLVLADARNLGDQAHGPYSIAFIPLNGLAHFATLDDRLLMLEATHARLAPGARLALDVDLEGPRRLLKAPGQLWHLGTWELPEVDQAEDEAIASVSHFVSAEQVVTGQVAVTHFYDALTARGEVRRSVTRMALATLTPDEVGLTLERAGFTVEAIYGSYDLDPIGPGDERAIFVAHSQPQS